MHERALRRAVAQLSRCPIEDIEAVWSELRTDEQDRLRPLLAQAGSRLSQRLSTPAMPSVSPQIACAGTQRLAAYIGSLREQVAARALASLDAEQRSAVLRALPKITRGHLGLAASTIVLRPAVAAALRSSVIAASDAATHLQPECGTAAASTRRPRWRPWRKRPWAD